MVKNQTGRGRFATAHFHEFGPVCGEEARILILGSFPSVISRRAGFYYAHPQNRFWKVLSAVFGEDAGETKEEKTAFLIKHEIALWDAAESCDIVGSADAAMRNVTPNDIPGLVAGKEIKAVFTNGKKAHELYSKYISGNLDLPEICLPSTSPANAAFTLRKLTEIWGAEIKKVLTI